MKTVTVILALVVCYLMADQAVLGQDCGNDCEEGVNRVTCLVNPCQTATCAVPGASCCTDNCGDCRGRWYFLGIRAFEVCSG